MEGTNELRSRSYNFLDFIRKVIELENFYMIVDETKEIITANYNSEIWKKYFSTKDQKLNLSGKDEFNNPIHFNITNFKNSFRKNDMGFFKNEIFLQGFKLKDQIVYVDMLLELDNGYFAAVLIFEPTTVLEIPKAKLSLKEVVELMNIFGVSALYNKNSDANYFYTSQKFKKYARVARDVNEFQFLEQIIHPGDVDYAKQYFLEKANFEQRKNAVFRIRNTQGVHHFIFCKAVPISLDDEEGQLFIFANLNPEILMETAQNKNISFFFSGIDRKVLYQKKRDFKSLETTHNRALSDFALAHEEKEKIDSSIEKCLMIGESECNAQLQLSNEKPQNYNLKQIRINSDTGELLGFFSLVKPSSLKTKKLNKEVDKSFYENILGQLDSSIIVTDDDGFIEYANIFSKQLFHINEGDNFKNIYDVFNPDSYIKSLESQIGSSKIVRTWIFKDEKEGVRTIKTIFSIFKISSGENFLLLQNKDVTLQEKMQQEKFKVIKNLQNSYHKLLESDNENTNKITKYVEDIKWLKSERALLNAFFNSFSHAAFIIDREMSIKYYNEKANKLIMNLNGIYLGRHLKLDEYHLPCQNSHFIKYVEEAFQGKKLKLQSTSVIPGHKKPRTFEVSFIPMQNVGRQGNEYISCNFTDVSESHRRQSQLIMFEDIVKNTNDGIVVTKGTPLHSPGPEIIYVNMATEKMTGYYAEELIGKTPRIFQGAKTSRKVLDRIKHSLIKGRPIKEELINYTKAGSPYWVELTISPIYNTLGEITCFVSHQKDITKRKLWEDERSSMIQHLLMQNEELEQFAFITSHNLRAPVARLLGLTDIINTELEKGRNPKELFNHVETSAQKLDEIIKDLNHILAYKKKIGDKKELIYFEEQLEQVKVMLDTSINTSGAIITSDFTECPTIFSIIGYIQSILQTLIHNAIKFSKTNEVPKISLKSYHQNKNICLEVADNGIGFPVQVTDKNFRLYKRYHPEIPGKGISLFLVKSHIEMLKGRLEVKTEKGIGTTFRVIFPLK